MDHCIVDTASAISGGRGEGVGGGREDVGEGGGSGRGGREGGCGGGGRGKRRLFLVDADEYLVV